MDMLERTHPACGTPASLPALGPSLTLRVRTASGSDRIIEATQKSQMGRSLPLPVLLREHLRLNQLAQNMADQVVRFLNPLRIVARNDQRQIAKRRDATTAAAKQTNNFDSLLARFLARAHDIWRRSRSRNGETYIAFRSQCLDLSGENILKSSVVGNASQRAAIGSQRNRRQPTPLL